MINPIEILASKIAVCLVEQVKVGKFSFEVFNYRPGDTIIIKTKEHLSEVACERIEKILEMAFPGMKAVILENGMDMEILREQRKDLEEQIFRSLREAME